jgi:hypothetical protein
MGISDRIDTTYKPILQMADILDEKSYAESVKNRIKTITEIEKKVWEPLDNNAKKNTVIMCVTHGENLGIIKSFMDGKWNENNINLFGGYNFCSWIQYK